MTIFTGTVEEGKKRGAALGYPTVNIALSDESVSGIFAAVVTVAHTEYPAAAFADPTRGILEAYLLDFSDNLYGREISIELKQKIRDTEKFDTDAALKAAIAEDVRAVRQCFSI